MTERNTKPPPAGEAAEGRCWEGPLAPEALSSAVPSRRARSPR